MTQKHVLIAGAGPAGMTLAFRLAGTHTNQHAEERIHISLVEPRTGFDKYPSMAGRLHPATLSIFEKIGILADIRDTALALTGSDLFVDGRHVMAATVPTVDCTLAVDQSRLMSLLGDKLQSLAQHPSGTFDLRLGEQAGDFTNGRNEVTLACKKGGKTNVLHGTWLAACDGADSPIRAHLGVDFPLESPLPQGNRTYAFRFNALFPHALPADRTAQFYGADTRLMLIPYRHGDELRYQINGNWGAIPGLQAILDADEPLTASCPVPADLQRTLADEVEKRCGLLPVENSVANLSIVREQQRIATSMQVNHVFLVGDAGHLFLPEHGDGLNQAITGGWELGTLLTSHTPGAILTYEAKRRPVVQDTMRILLRARDMISYATLRYLPAVTTDHGWTRSNPTLPDPAERHLPSVPEADRKRPNALPPPPQH